LSKVNLKIKTKYIRVFCNDIFSLNFLNSIFTTIQMILQFLITFLRITIQKPIGKRINEYNNVPIKYNFLVKYRRRNSCQCHPRLLLHGKMFINNKEAKDIIKNPIIYSSFHSKSKNVYRFQFHIVTIMLQ